MDKTALVQEVAELFRLNGHRVETSVKIGHREIDIVAKELQGILPKTFLIECADYGGTVGVDKLQYDERKLDAARQELHEQAVLVHVCRHGYTPDAAGYAHEKGLDAITVDNLRANLINFDPYIAAMKNDQLRCVIEREYQPTTAQFDGTSERLPAIQFLDRWINSDSNYLILLGDYGVGKSWLLRRYLYVLIDRYERDRLNAPLPFFVQLQRFTKAFDFQNLILKTFEQYGLSGAHYDAFLYLVRNGKIVLLLDSFDEMAQHLSRTTIRENLTAIFDVANGDARIVMTSRPNYFENRSERILLVERLDRSQPHSLDLLELKHQHEVSERLAARLEETPFARLNDLTPDQRTRLFRVVLDGKPAAVEALTGLMRRFQALANLSQRAVIARLLTTVAETLAAPGQEQTLEGRELIPADLNEINEGKIFEIVVHNLLKRDQGIGTLSAADRLTFLKSFAVFLQRRGSDFFATPAELRTLVRTLFADALARTDTPEQTLESLYRVCRRHSGLTTEGQFYDTSGVIDLPVSEHDLESRVGFSHNSLREYLVAMSVVDAIKRGIDGWGGFFNLSFNDQIYHFVADASAYDDALIQTTREAYLDFSDSKITEILLGILYFLYRDTKDITLFGNPPRFVAADLSLTNFSGADMQNAKIMSCLLQETNFEGADLRRAIFDDSIIERVKFDDAKVGDAEFSKANLTSVQVYDEYDRRTSAILRNREAAQWLFSRGGRVKDAEQLNPYLGKPWYRAAREVMFTISKRIVGTHDSKALAKGTELRNRPFAVEFVDFLMEKGVLHRLRKSSNSDGWVVKLNPTYMSDLNDFTERGRISPTLAPFFQKHHKV